MMNSSSLIDPNSLLTISPRSQVATAIAVCLVCIQVGRNFDKRNESQNYYVENYGRWILEHLPQVIRNFNQQYWVSETSFSFQDCILLVHGDLASNSVRYAQLAEKVRPDVRILDGNLLQADWFGCSRFCNSCIPLMTFVL
jgi:hypothetical protein